MCRKDDHGLIKKNTEVYSDIMLSLHQVPYSIIFIKKPTHRDMTEPCCGPHNEETRSSFHHDIMQGPFSFQRLNHNAHS